MFYCTKCQCWPFIRLLYHSYHATNTDLCLGSSSAGFSGSGYKAAPSAGGPKNSSQQWQQNPRPSSGPNKPWMPLNSASRQQTQPSKPVPQPAKPNYVPSFSVIGGREERGIRGPAFGKASEQMHESCKFEMMPFLIIVWAKNIWSCVIQLFVHVSAMLQSPWQKKWMPETPRL